MSDNIVKSSDIDSANKKKTTTKKVANTKSVTSSTPGKRIVVFESGASYTSNGIRFTKDNRIQEVTESEAELFLSLDNFRLPTQEEVDKFNASKEG